MTGFRIEESSILPRSLSVANARESNFDLLKECDDSL